MYNDGNEVGELSSNFTLSLSSLPKNSLQSELKTEIKADDFYTEIYIQPQLMDRHRMKRWEFKAFLKETILGVGQQLVLQ